MDGLHSSSYFQVPQYLYQSFGDCIVSSLLLLILFTFEIIYESHYVLRIEDNGYTNEISYHNELSFFRNPSQSDSKKNEHAHTCAAGRGACGIMVITVGSGISNLCSNPGQAYLYFSMC